MLISVILVVILPIIIFIGLSIKSFDIIQENSLFQLIFSSNWKPLNGNFGFASFIISSLLVTFIALIIAVPICILTAIFFSQYASKKILNLMHTIIDILAGLPSVIYGVWGILIIVPFISDHLAPMFGVETSGYSILAGGLVLSIMIVPFILNIQIEILKTIPIEYTEASLSLGATKWETIKYVILKRAKAGIISSIGLGLSRAFGETIAVLMVVGNVVRIPNSIFDAGYPLPSLIANNYGEMMSIPKYDSALMFGALLLFIIVMLFNYISRKLINSYECKI
ncbi:MAG: phosphate ABC transporter permease subunit PstC [Marinilabiliales bacterium]